MASTRLLVVEDEFIVAADLSSTLEELGYDLCPIASTAEEALATAASMRPELVLMDIVLRGDRGGIDAAKELRNRLHIPVIFLTAYAADEVIEEAAAAQPYGYLIKPFERDVLRSAIEAALHRARLEAQLEGGKQDA